jgi:hypothetical protein
MTTGLSPGRVAKYWDQRNLSRTANAASMWKPLPHSRSTAVIAAVHVSGVSTSAPSENTSTKLPLLVATRQSRRDIDNKATAAGIGRDGWGIARRAKANPTPARFRKLVFPPAANQPPYPKRIETEWTVVTDTAGTFRLSGLNEGRYQLCAQAPKTIWLHPCEWGLQPPSAFLSAAQPIASVTIVMKKGVAVPIRVEDSGQLLSQYEGKVRGAYLLLGIRSDARTFRVAPVKAQDAQGRNHQIVIPFNASVKLVAYSPFFQLADAIGLPIAAPGATIPVAIASGNRLQL